MLAGPKFNIKYTTDETNAVTLVITSCRSSGLPNQAFRLPPPPLSAESPIYVQLPVLSANLDSPVVNVNACRPTA